MRSSLISFLAALLIILEFVLVLLSWVFSATAIWQVRSLLSSEGIRWFLGHTHDMILSPALVWILFFAIAYGIFTESGFRLHADSRHERLGRHAVGIVLFLYLLIIGLLVAIPHAILLSSTGSLFPSPFSRAIVPMIAFGLLISSIVYGLAARSLVSFSAIIAAAQKGLASSAPILLIYVLFIQFYESIRYVFF